MSAPAAVRSLVDRLSGLVPGPELALADLEIDGPSAYPSAFDVNTLALGTASAWCLASGQPRVDAGRVMAAFSGRVLRDGQPIPGWAPLSGHYRTKNDRTIQLHCNFPHHAAGVVARLGCEPTKDAVQEAVLDWDPIELENALIADGLIPAYLRTLDEWNAHPHAQATAALPAISVERLGDAPPRQADRRHRVLDCSRVLAGPAAGQALASTGADVLRLGAERLPSVDVAVIGTGAGKRNAFADADEPAGRAAFSDLLAGADVWLDAYRPGSLAGRGFDLDAVAPGTVVVQLCAFDWTGPWAGRRGYDTIVQATTGLVEAGREASGEDRPRPLPVPALDFGTGYLAAFAARRLLDHQAEVGGTWLARVSLLRTRNLLVSLGGPQPFTPAPVEPPETDFRTFPGSDGAVTVAAPLIGTDWTHGPQPLGSSPATWA